MMRAPAAAVALVLGLSGLASALDVPLAGRRLDLRANPTAPGRRSATITLRDPALAAPFGDPTVAASLVVSAGAGADVCRAEVLLDPSGWNPIRGDGPGNGWRYRVPGPGTQGIRRVIVRPGRLVVTARGAGWPCGLTAASQPLPVSVVLRLEGTRYCAAFGGTVARNAPGRVLAFDAAPPAACPKSDVTVANLNVLHGIFCPAGTDSCRRGERIDLLFQWIAGRGCPDVVTLQEIWDPSVPLIGAHLATVCPFPYEQHYVRVAGVDDAIILSRYPVVDSGMQLLDGNFRHVTFVRIDHPLGPVDVFTTHLASGSDGAQFPCTPPPGGTCPAECVAAGASTRRQCQGVQVGLYVAARHDVVGPALVTGDFNEDPASFVYTHLTGLGWVDTYLAAGNLECNPATGAGCTSGRDDESLGELESPASNEDERIDYIFLVPPVGSVCVPALDPASDEDGDGTATRLFADSPNPFTPSCGPTPDPICWPSDHEGAELDLDCG